jgi:hypothetical protein
MALIVLALIVVGIAVWQFYMSRSLWRKARDLRTAMLIVYAAGVLDCIAVLLLGVIVGSLLL